MHLWDTTQSKHYHTWYPTSFISLTRISIEQNQSEQHQCINLQHVHVANVDNMEPMGHCQYPVQTMLHSSTNLPWHHCTGATFEIETKE
mmetsp:Transcript_34022/g.64770  ORF Transcript_34022/g.64770 Transcript_34022/m.64770 type:complete len:89 (-) Transcript_34022:3064-3330(-)